MSKAQVTEGTATPVHRCPRWHQRARHALRHSVRARLVAVFLLLALVLTVSFIGGAQRMLASGWQQAAKPLVIDYMDRLVADLGTPPDVTKAQALTRQLPISLRIDGPQVNWSSRPYPAAIPARFEGNTDDAFWVRRTVDGHNVRFAIASTAWEDRPHAFWWTLAVLMLTTALAYAYVRRLLRPLDDIAAGTQRFGAGDFSTPIPWPPHRHNDELGELAQTVNTMGRDIQAMLDAKRGLLLAISHELRSPLTRARLNTELLPETPDVLATRQALLRDLGEMTALTQDLLESERLQDGHRALHAEWVHLEHVIEDVLFDHPDLEIHLAPNLPEAHVDAMRVRLLLRNLLSNAERHAPGSRIELSACRNAQGELEVQVRDHGPGVPAEHLQQLGEAFFRPDNARTRQLGGVGLGLYLCRLVMQAHGGRLVFSPAEPGLRVTATFPARVFQRPSAEAAGESATGTA